MSGIHASEFDRGERIYPIDTQDAENVAQHLERYRFATSLCRTGDTILDAACGAGYGAQMLSAKAGHVVGLDNSDHALAYARENYSRSNIDFLQADLNGPVALASTSFDGVVCFETVEHVADHRHLLAEFRRLLKPGGFVVISTPDRDVYTNALGTTNHFHTREFSRPEFTGVLDEYFRVEQLYGQVPYRPRRWTRPLRLLTSIDRLNLRKLVLRRSAAVRRIRQQIRPIGNGANTGATLYPIADWRSDSTQYVFLVAVGRGPE